MLLPTEEKVLLALVPSTVMAVMHTTMIRASITAYSTAVGPFSSFRKLTSAREIVVMICLRDKVWGRRRSLPAAKHGTAGRPCQGNRGGSHFPAARRLL